MNHAPSAPELLSPAGNWDCARAAVAAGADAIFFGLPQFNARLRADNFTLEDLPELMKFLHDHGVKGFVTMNTLIFPHELQAAEDQLRAIDQARVDALIIQDLGLAQLAQQVAPNVEIHASTQMTITAPEALKFLQPLFKLDRAVLARELSLQEISRFQKAEQPQTPLEVFVHGALCVAYSGQCLTSESLGQRSANRGECAQACRMPYQLVVDGELRDLREKRYLLSPQDLAAVDLVPELIQAGVASFKIEGRLKSPEYVAAVTRVYRKAIDAALAQQNNPISPLDRYELEMTFSRGLTTGWLQGSNHPYLTHGRFGKKRGPLLGTISRVGNGFIELDPTTLNRVIPLLPGDGVVFDAGEDRNHEQGATIWKIEGTRLLFQRHFSGLDFSRILVGHTLYKTSDPKLDREIRKFWQNTKLTRATQALTLALSGAPEQPLQILASFPSPLDPTETISHEFHSEILLQAAEKQPLSSENLQQRFTKLTGTPFHLAALTATFAAPSFLPVGDLNAIRRQLTDELEPIFRAASTPARKSPTIHSFTELLPPAEPSAASTKPPELSILCRTEDQLEAAIQSNASTIYLDFEDPRRFAPTVREFRNQSHSQAKLLLATPRILKSGEMGYLKLIERAEPDGLLLRNLAALEVFKNTTSLLKHGDFSLNLANPITAKLLKHHAQLDRLTISYDLNIQQVLNLLQLTPPQWLELTLHQHMPLFHMEHCVFCTFLSDGKDYKDCGRPCESHSVKLRDRVGQNHTLLADVGCRNTLFNARAQTGASFYPQLRAAGLRHFRIELLTESFHDAERTIRSYQDLLQGSQSADQVISNLEVLTQLGVTQGTLEV